MWATLDLSPVNLADTTSRYFLENMGYPETIKIVIIKKCPKLLRIYGEGYMATVKFNPFWCLLQFEQ